MKTVCERLADRFVDYVDGELPEDEAHGMTQHLADCERCRRTVQAMERSLGLARVIWSDNLGDSEPAVKPVPVRKGRRIRLYAVAASILIVGSVLVSTVLNRHSRHPPISVEELKQQIIRAGTAAELLAATQILARCEGTESIVDNQYRYILREYAGTPAAEDIRAKHGSRLGGTQ